ncbi:putative DNA-binding protein [Virgibacillus dakarensis]|uniref:putative DNA-binding protein n=1 Tax=Virgibacillus dakarensis TaxID=1917889 RepID=UPI000B44C947|nr:putative DNA-binding protein [Virgibacillus dakarensis]MTW86662.1 putative DNA-binding protein [Virgibacillus dakarensis]
MLEKTTRVNYLFDFYQALLTPKQRSYMEMYYLEDYSLGEISELSQVSRQAVYDNIKRTEMMLETYEKKLHLYEKFQKRAALLEKLEQAAEATKASNAILTMIEQLKELD